MDWKAIGDRVIVKKLEEDDTITSSGIHVVSNEKNDKTKKGEVVSIGSGKLVDGKKVPLSVEVGQTIIYNGTYGTDIGSFHSSNSNNYLILHDDDILAVVAG